MDIGLHLHSFFSGRRCTHGWTRLHDINLRQKLDLLLSFMMLGCFVCVFWESMGVGEHVAFSGWVSISSFLAPLHAQLIASLICTLHLHALLWFTPFPAPGLLSSCPCKLHPPSKVFLHKAVPAPSAGSNPSLDSPSSFSLKACVPPLPREETVSVPLLDRELLQD